MANQSPTAPNTAQVYTVYLRANAAQNDGQPGYRQAYAVENAALDIVYGELLDFRVLRRRVWATDALHAVARFKEWQANGYSDEWLANPPLPLHPADICAGLVVHETSTGRMVRVDLVDGYVVHWAVRDSAGAMVASGRSSRERFAALVNNAGAQLREVTA